MRCEMKDDGIVRKVGRGEREEGGGMIVTGNRF